MAEPRPPRVLVDTCVYIDLITRNETLHKDSSEPRWKSARRLFKAVEQGRVVLAATPLVEAEVMCHGEVRQGIERVQKLVKTWFLDPDVAWSDVDRVLVRRAVDVLNKYRSLSGDSNKMGTADSLHLAAAIRLQCDFLMTHDQGFPIGHRVEKVLIIRPDIVWQTSLLDDDS